MTPREAINTPTGQKITAAAIALAAGLVIHFEGVVPKVYRDPIGIKTACVGHVDSSLQMGQTFTAEQCQELLSADLSTAAKGVQGCVREPMSDGEFAAYTSFTFNVGTEAFCGSTLVRELNAGNHGGACAQLSLWIHAGGEVLPGLVARRAAERRLCEGRA